jgi:hypothetical protein
MPEPSVSDLNQEFVAVRYLVAAEPSPGLLVRLLQPLARRDLAADALHAVRDGETLRAEIILHAMPAEMVHLVAGNLGQVIGVLSVRVEQPGGLRAAA